MDVYGRLRPEKALNREGREYLHAPEYSRTISLSKIPVILPPDTRVSWTSLDSVPSGHLEFDSQNDEKVIKTCKVMGADFNALCLEPVNNERDGNMKFPVEPDFFPILHKFLQDRRDWTRELHFPGCASFQPFLMEWTEKILEDHNETLNHAGIYGAVAVSRYPYNFCKNIMRAFIELWSPLTNTLHCGSGEASISLLDLNRIGGLPISGVPYDEFLPSNKQLAERDGDRKLIYPPTVPELLLIHTDLCLRLKSSVVTWSQWIDYFYRGEVTMKASANLSSKAPTFNPQIRSMPFDVSPTGQLSGFLALWLSRFLFPHNGNIVRPETFVMASLMAEGIKISLAPTVLGFIYHRLGEISRHPKGPGAANLAFPIHYLIGWLGEHFPNSYKPKPAHLVPDKYPLLARYAGRLPETLTIFQSRLLFRGNDFVRFYPNLYEQNGNVQLMDDGSLSEDHFEFLLIIRCANLAVRVGGDMWIEPYNPNRFSRQFGYDQGVPANSSITKVSQRHFCGIDQLATAQVSFYHRQTHAMFTIPHMYHVGACSWWYCSYWMKSSMPYLGFSIYRVHETMTKKVMKRRDPIFVVQRIKDVPRKADGASRVFKTKVSTQKKVKNPTGKRPNDPVLVDKSSNDKEDYKRARYNKSDDSASSDNSTSKACFIDIPIGNESEDNDVAVTFIEGIDVEQEQVDYESPTHLASGDNPNTEFSYTQQMSHNLQGALAMKFSLNDLSEKIMSSGDATGEITKQFVVSLFKDIFNNLSSTLEPKKVLELKPKITKSINKIYSVIGECDSGRDVVDWFCNQIAHFFTLCEKIDNESIVLKGTINQDAIDAALKEQQECVKMQKILSTKLSAVMRETEEIKRAKTVLQEEEANLRLRRIELETDEASVGKKINQLESSLEDSKKLEEELQQTLAEAGQDKVLAVETLKVEMGDIAALFHLLMGKK